MRRWFVAYGAAVICLAACADDAPDEQGRARPEPWVVRDPADAEAVPSRVEGDLVLSGPHLTGTIVLPQVESIGKDLLIEYTETLEAVELPALDRVGVRISISDNRALVRVDLPQLKTTSAVTVRGNLVLETLVLPEAREASSFIVSGNLGLRLVSAPLLEPVASEDDAPGLTPSVSIQNNPALSELDLPAVTDLLRLTVSDNLSLHDISLPALRRIASLSLLGGLLQTISLKSLVEVYGESIFFTSTIDAPRLTQLDLPNLRWATGLSVATSSLRSIALPTLESAQELSFATSTLDRFSAPKLTKLTGETYDDTVLPRAHEYELGALATGCEHLHLVGGLPDCAFLDIAPACTPPDPPSPWTREGCACDPSGDVTLANCPAAP